MREEPSLSADGPFDLRVLQQDELIGHASDVVGYYAGKAFVAHLVEVASREFLRVIDPVIEERRHDLFGLVVLDFKRAAGVERVVEISLLLQTLRLDLRRELRKASRVATNVVETRRADSQCVAARGLDEILGEDVLHQLQRLVEQKLFIDTGVFLLDLAIAAAEDVDVLANMANIEQPGFDAIVQVRGEIGDLVGKIDQLRFERRAQVEKIFGELRMRVRAVVARVFDDALANAKREIESAMRGIPLLEVLDDSQGMKIVVEAAAVTAQAAVESALSRVAKGWMADIVNQCERFGKILVEAERAGGSACYLCDLNGMGQAASEMVRGAAGEDLRLTSQAAEGARLHDAFTITLEGRARGAERRRIDTGQKRIARISGDRAPMEIDCHSQFKCNGSGKR